MQEVDDEYQKKYRYIPGVFSAATPMWDVEYADDTVLIAKSADILQRFLNILVISAEKRGLLLNVAKCENLPIHFDKTVCISSSNGEVLQIPQTPFVKYLGVLLAPNSSSNREINRRLSQARTAAKLLQPFFKNRNLALKWKLTVYQQIIGAILTYALDSLAIEKKHILQG